MLGDPTLCAQARQVARERVIALCQALTKELATVYDALRAAEGEAPGAGVTVVGLLKDLEESGLAPTRYTVAVRPIDDDTD